MLRIAGGVALGVAITVLLYVAATKLRTVLAEDESDTLGTLIVVLIVAVGSLAAYFITTEVLG